MMPDPYEDPSQHAASEGSSSIVRSLRLRRRNPKPSPLGGYRQALHRAPQIAKDREVNDSPTASVQALGRSSTRKNNENATALSLAAECGLLEIVNALLERNADINLPAFCSPLHQAVKHRHLQVVQRLLECGANPDQQDQYGISPGQTAYSLGHLEIVKLFREKRRGAHSTSTTRPRIKPARDVPKVKVVRGKARGKLVPLPAVERQDENGWTALTRAVRGDDFATVNMLLDLGADHRKAAFEYSRFF
ncbi:hypothetical protein FALCPG4_017242 [Fusarium falciforme]